MFGDLNHLCIILLDKTTFLSTNVPAGKTFDIKIYCRADFHLFLFPLLLHVFANANNKIFVRNTHPKPKRVSLKISCLVGRVKVIGF